MVDFYQKFVSLDHLMLCVHILFILEKVIMFNLSNELQ